MNRREMFAKVAGVAAVAQVPIESAEVIEADPRPLAIVIKAPIRDRVARQKFREEWDAIHANDNLPPLILIHPQLEISVVVGPKGSPK